MGRYARVRIFLLALPLVAGAGFPALADALVEGPELE